jgi:hypothetical protein
VVPGETDVVLTRVKRRFDVKLLLASLGIAAGVVIVLLGFQSSVTGREQQLLPDEIESIDPIRGATQVPQQTQLFVDLITGYEAVLVIDGQELTTFTFDDVSGEQPPGLGQTDGGDQVSLPPGALFDPGNATLTFQPGPSQPIESFAPGQHTATVVYWKVEDGRQRSRSFTWSFYVV